MKSLPKILLSTFLTIFILQMLGLIFLLAAPSSTQAAEAPELQIKIGADLKDVVPDKDGKLSIDWIGKYISAIYKYAIGVVGILAAVVLMIGGIVWITAGGNQTRVGEAKAWIGASLTGLVIALTSYMILWTVNPALVQFRPIKVATVEDKSSGCCEKDEIDQGTLSQSSCENNGGNWGGEGTIWDDVEKECTTTTCAGERDGECGNPEKPYCVVKANVGYTRTYGCAASEIGSRCYLRFSISCPYPLVCSDDNAAGTCKEKDVNSCIGKSFGTPCGENKACNKSEDCVTCEADEGDYCQATPCCPGFVCEARGSDFFNHCYAP